MTQEKTTKLSARLDTEREAFLKRNSYSSNTPNYNLPQEREMPTIPRALSPYELTTQLIYESGTD